MPDQTTSPLHSDTAAPRKWLAGLANDVPERGRLVVEAGGKTVGIFRIDGALHAYENVCPHQGGPVCQGLMVPRVIELIDAGGASVGNRFDESDMHIVCPWHGFEFSIRTGRHAGGIKASLRSVAVEQQGSEIYVTI